MRLGKLKIFTFVKPSDTATMSTHRVARFVADELDSPITWDESVASEDLDTLIIVAGGAAFSRHRDDLGRAILRSERVIYVSLDYLSQLPSVTGRAQSWYRKSFRLRHRRGMRPVDHWTTCTRKASLTPDSVLINWNALEWSPAYLWRGGKSPLHLLYYGSWRPHRAHLFDKYFRRPAVRTLISNGSGRFERYSRCEHAGSIHRAEISRTLAQAGLGLYLMDPRSETEDHFPAGRFYEMLGAGLPMVFDESATRMPGLRGYNLTPHVIEDDLLLLMRRRHEIADIQRSWREDYRGQVERQFREMVR